MPFDTPMTLGGWLAEVSGLALMRFHASVMVRLASGRYSDTMRRVAPQDELRRMTRNAWVFIAVYAAIGVAIALGVHALAWFLVLPRLLGAPVMLLFTLIQHVEMAETHRHRAEHALVHDRMARPVPLHEHEQPRGAPSLSAGAVLRTAGTARGHRLAGSCARSRVLPDQPGGAHRRCPADPGSFGPGGIHPPGAAHGHRRRRQAAHRTPDDVMRRIYTYGGRAATRT